MWSWRSLQSWSLSWYLFGDVLVEVEDMVVVVAEVVVLRDVLLVVVVVLVTCS